MGAFAVWRTVLRPEIVLTEQAAAVELGSGFDPAGMVKEIRNASPGALLIDDASLFGKEEEERPDGDYAIDGADLRVPPETGDFTVTYRLLPEGIFAEWEPLTELFLRYAPVRTVQVTVEDTTAPELTVIEEPLRVQVGTTVPVMDLVTAVRDNAGAGNVDIALSDGTDEYTFDEAGTCEVRVRAKDPSGNRTEKTAEVIVEVPDREAPVLSGLSDAVAAVGSEFDLLKGVTAEDDTDPEPKIRTKPKKLDTSKPGVVTVTYTAKDREGRKTTGTRRIIIAEQTAEYEGGTYPVHWDISGIEGQPYLVAVNRVLDTVTVYQQDEGGQYTVPVQAFACSTGPRTPAGYFRTRERYRWKYLFENSWGQYATRIINHILFHSVPYYSQSPDSLEYNEYNLLGTPASLGCVRLCVKDAKWIYDNCPNGFPCAIFDDGDYAGPLGKPDIVPLDTEDERRGWDPTDSDVNNPWGTAGQQS